MSEPTYPEMLKELTLAQLASVYSLFTPEEFWHYISIIRNTEV